MAKKGKHNLDTVKKAASDLNVDDIGTDRKLLIAVDFGTTFSGVAWAQTRRVRTLYQLIRAYRES